MTFVEISAQVLVDPTEVAAVTDNGAGGTRVYMRGSGARSYLEVNRPLAEVSSALLTRPPRAGRGALYDELRRPRSRPSGREL